MELTPQHILCWIAEIFWECTLVSCFAPLLGIIRYAFVCVLEAVARGSVSCWMEPKSLSSLGKQLWILQQGGSVSHYFAMMVCLPILGLLLSHWRTAGKSVLTKLDDLIMFNEVETVTTILKAILPNSSPSFIIFVAVFFHWGKGSGSYSLASTCTNWCNFVENLIHYLNRVCKLPWDQSENKKKVCLNWSQLECQFPVLYSSFVIFALVFINVHQRPEDSVHA